ncbi:MAG: nuclear transport factor 2 family protein [Acidimicrobiales bacterium]
MTPGDEIRNLLGQYCERIDTADFDGVGELFEHAALADEHGRELARGSAAVRDFYRAGTLLHDGSPRTKHVVTNTVLDVSEGTDRAGARSSYVVLQQVGDGPLHPIITGRYHDSFERHDGRWRFAERRFLVDLVGDLRDHLAYELG